MLFEELSKSPRWRQVYLYTLLTLIQVLYTQLIVRRIPRIGLSDIRRPASLKPKYAYFLSVPAMDKGPKVAHNYP